MSITLIIVVVTCAFSFYALSSPHVFEELKFNPYLVWHHKKVHRLVSMVFLHADFVHLAFNMLALYSFGEIVERDFQWLNPQTENMEIFGTKGGVMFVVFYFSAAIFANLWNLFKHKDDYSFSSVGASGATSAVMFAFILFHPNAYGFTFFFIPLGKTPAWVVGLLFLAMSTFMSRRGGDRIDHVAHFWGAIFGLLFPLIGNYLLAPRFIEIVIP